MDQLAIDAYYEKVHRRNELNQLRGLIEGEHGTAKQLSTWNYEFSVNWQWFTDHRIALPEVNGRYDFTRSPEERAYEEHLKTTLVFDDLEAKLNRKKGDFLSTVAYLIATLDTARKTVQRDDLETLNNLGVIQGTGSKLDILAAEISLLHSILKDRKR